jgi:RNA polymerase sigma-70 factor (ECF subfamily)
MRMAPENIQIFPSDLSDLSNLSDLSGLSGLSIAVQPRATPLDDLENVVALFQPRVFRFLLANLRDRDAAETLTQETFLRAWTARSSFREDCSVGTWLIRIALNLARDHTRTGRFRFWKNLAANAVDVADVSSSVPSGEVSSEERLIAQQQVAQIWQTVAGLSQRQRTIFLLRFLEDMDIPEIAAATGLPLGTVKSHLYRALNLIRARHNAPAKEAR